MNVENCKFVFVYGDGGKAPEGAVCFAYPGMELSPEQIEAAERGRQAHATYMKKITDEQDEKRHYYLPKLKAPLLSCPFCSMLAEQEADKDQDGWYFVLCTFCGARGPKTLDGYLAAAWLWQSLRQDREDPLLDREYPLLD